MSRTLSPRELPKLLKPGMHVFITGASNEPGTLIEAIQAEPDCAAGVTFYQFPLAALNHTDWCSLHPRTEAVVFFMAPQLQRGLAEGRVHFVPLGMRDVWQYLEQQHFDLVLTQASLNGDGQLGLGPNADFTQVALKNSKTAVVELNRRCTPAAGMPQLTLPESHFLVESDRDLPVMPEVTLDAAARTIGARVAELIRDGDCIQTGIGRIPAAILQALGEKNDLGLHSGLIDDGVMGLIQSGNINGRRKTLDPGQHVVGMALGSTALYQWLGQTGEVLFREASYTHALEVIRRIDHFVSVNSAIEVDLYGQVNAEYAGHRQISGIGGAVDFMRSARASRDGRSIVALTATARGGQVSRIVPRVAMVSALRSDTDIIVTEYGVAHLKNASLDERARSLIELAAPEFREGLHEALLQAPKT